MFELDQKYFSGNEKTNQSSSVPGSPAKSAQQQHRVQSRRSPHSRTLSEEASFVPPTGAGPFNSFHSTPGTVSKDLQQGGALAPVQPPGRKVSPSDLLMSHQLPTSTPPPVVSALRPINNKTKRSRCNNSVIVFM